MEGGLEAVKRKEYILVGPTRACDIVALRSVFLLIVTHLELIGQCVSILPRGRRVWVNDTAPVRGNIGEMRMKVILPNPKPV